MFAAGGFSDRFARPDTDIERETVER